MYLSQLILNPRSRRVISELADPYQMHRTLSRAFTQELSDEDGKAALVKSRPLYRVDETPGGKVLLLVQSQLEPQWNFLDGSGYLLTDAQCKKFAPQVQSGQMLAFRLRANPTKSDPHQRAEKRNRGKRVGLFTDAQRRDWLLKQAERYGFDVPIVGKTPDGQTVYDFRLTDEKATRANPKSGNQALFSAAMFEGRLVVRDKSTFIQALENGIGPAKAFGFGLLSLRRA